VEPILVSEVSFVLEKNQEVDILIINLIFLNMSTINLKLADQTLHAFYYLLERLYQKSSWGKSPIGLSLDPVQDSHDKNFGISNLKVLLH